MIDETTKVGAIKEVFISHGGVVIVKRLHEVLQNRLHRRKV